MKMREVAQNSQRETERCYFGAGKEKTRQDTWLPKPRVGGKRTYLRSPDHLGRSSEVKEIKS